MYTSGIKAQYDAAFAHDNPPPVPSTRAVSVLLRPWTMHGTPTGKAWLLSLRGEMSGVTASFWGAGTSRHAGHCGTPLRMVWLCGKTAVRRVFHCGHVRLFFVRCHVALICAFMSKLCIRMWVLRANYPLLCVVMSKLRILMRFYQQNMQTSFEIAYKNA